MLNDKCLMTRLVTVERRVHMGSSHTIFEVHRLFNLHNFEWMDQSLGSYNEKIVREFYAL